MDCIFCKIINGDIPSKKIYEDDLFIAILDINPQVDGHTLIIPKKHITDIKELDNDTLLELFNTSKKVANMLMEKLDAKAITYAINYGDSQAVKHLHLHLLPNYTIKEKELDVDKVYELLTK